MRTCLVLGLLLVCSGSVGCGLTDRKGSPSGGELQQPFSGLSTGPAAFEGSAPRRATSTLPPEVNGLLAGQVMDRFRRNPAGVVIQVVDVQSKEESKAPIEVYANNDGYFTIQGLHPGKHYQLVARVKDGSRVLTGAALATPPNPRLAIVLSEDLTSSSTPPLPKPPSWPEEGGADRKSDAKSSATSPAAVLDPPSRARSDSGQPGPSSWTQPAPPTTPLESSLPGSGAPSGDPSRMAVKDGFIHEPAASIPSVPAPTITVPPPPPGAGPAQPPYQPQLREVRPAPAQPIEPPATPVPPSYPPLPGVASPAGQGAATSPGAPRVPSCVLVGRQLESLALEDLNGNTWAYPQDGRGRVVLLDFWSTTCMPCLQALPHLQDLHRRYGARGLQVVGIAYERGERGQQGPRVEMMRRRAGTDYQILLGGGGAGPCPVQTQFAVTELPTLVLLDASGLIIWRSRGGLTQGQLQELEWILRRQLGSASR